MSMGECRGLYELYGKGIQNSGGQPVRANDFETAFAFNLDRVRSLNCRTRSLRCDWRQGHLELICLSACTLIVGISSGASVDVDVFVDTPTYTRVFSPRFSFVAAALSVRCALSRPTTSSS